MPPLSEESRNKKEQTRAYQLLRAVLSTLMLDNPNQVTKFQKAFFNKALTTRGLRPRSKSGWEDINNGLQNLTKSEVENIVLYVKDEFDKGYTIKFNEHSDDTGRDIIEISPSKRIEQFDEKKRILDTVLRYFHEIHDVNRERIQALYEEERNRNIEFASLSDRYQIILGDEVTERDIFQAIELDSLGYEEDNYVGIEEQCLKWARTNPFIYFMVKDLTTNRIIGYINAMPLERDFYDELKKDTMDDINIPANKILRYGISGQYSIYFASIVIHTSCRHRSFVLELLIKSIIDFFKEKANEGIIIDRMFAKEVSGPGKHLCESFGMEQSTENESIYEVSFYPPKFNSQHSLFADFYKFYDEFYKQNTVKD